MSREVLPHLFATGFGGFLGLSLLKFGNPPIMERWVTVPGNIYEFLLGSPWPIAWGYGFLAVVTVLGVGIVLRRNHDGSSELRRPSHNPSPPLWLSLLPLPWLVWQFVAAGFSVAPQLSGPTLRHFLACVVCFYLGLLCLTRIPRRELFWTALLGGFLLMLAAGWEQRFGGLEATRKYFFQYIYPEAKELPPDYLKKISSTRIFATLFYPNSLAGAVLLLLAPLLAFVGGLRRQFTTAARFFLMGVIGAGAMACLYWSGSKGGWLVCLGLGLLALLQLPIRKSLKTILLVCFLLAGITGFFWKYASFFQKGATSVSARMDYWQAAIRIAKVEPLFGTGPGTFSIPYQRIKRPESEMTRMVHNDYLEQASDSGVPGFLAYTGFIVLTLIWIGRRRVFVPVLDWPRFSVWLGLVGWACQCFMEFSLYIPALSWTGFAFLGFLAGEHRKLMDTLEATA